jgi:hypothetical protein
MLTKQQAKTIHGPKFFSPQACPDGQIAGAAAAVLLDQDEWCSPAIDGK